jgi:hypothetical protein
VGWCRDSSESDRGLTVANSGHDGACTRANLLVCLSLASAGDKGIPLSGIRRGRRDAKRPEEVAIGDATPRLCFQRLGLILGRQFLPS